MKDNIYNLKQLLKNDEAILNEWYQIIGARSVEEEAQYQADRATARKHYEMLQEEIKKHINDVMDRAYFDYQGEIYDKDYNMIEYIPSLVYLVTDDCDMEDDDIDDLNDFIQNDLYDRAWRWTEKRDELPEVMKTYFQLVRSELLDYCL